MVGLNSIPYSCKIICDWICIHYLLFMMVVSVDLPSVSLISDFGISISDLSRHEYLNLNLYFLSAADIQIPKSKFRNPKLPGRLLYSRYLAFQGHFTECYT